MLGRGLGRYWDGKFAGLTRKCPTSAPCPFTCVCVFDVSARRRIILVGQSGGILLLRPQRPLSRSTWCPHSYHPSYRPRLSQLFSPCKWGFPTDFTAQIGFRR